MRLLIVVTAACTQGSSPPPPPVIAQVAPPQSDAILAPTCVATGAMIRARVEDRAVVACYLVAKPGDDVDCWRFEPTTRVWSYATTVQRAVLEAVPRVTATQSAARVCLPDGSDCKTVPLAGMPPVPPDDELTGATNADRSIIALRTHTGPIQVFDVGGKRLATIKPWAAGMNGREPSFFRDVHVLGEVLEVRIADTPITSAIRLYHARTGKQIADVFGGGPMDDTADPGELGGTHYGFVTFEPRAVLVVDVATGKQVAAYPLGDLELSYSFVGRTRTGHIAGVVGTTAFVVDAGKLSTVEAPTCTPEQLRDL